MGGGAVDNEIDGVADPDAVPQFHRGESAARSRAELLFRSGSRAGRAGPLQR